MDKEIYKNIIESYLYPFVRNKFEETHFIHQDNDPKHTSKLCVDFFKEAELNWV